MQQLQLEKCLSLVDSLISYQTSGPFREPVYWKERGLTDYPKIIRRPMDLGTVKTNLLNGKYREPIDFATDIRLIWSNCMIYNQEQSDLYKTAMNLHILFDNKYRELFEDETKDLTIKDKQLFTELFQKLTPAERGKVATMIYEKCRDCVKVNTSTEIDINIDKMDIGTFRCVEAYAKSCVYHSESSSVSNSEKKR